MADRPEGRKYLCPYDDTLLLISDLTAGEVSAVFCKRCHKRHTVRLGVPQTSAGVISRNADGTPRPLNAPPPIETRTVLPRRGFEESRGG